VFNHRLVAQAVRQDRAMKKLVTPDVVGVEVGVNHQADIVRGEPGLFQPGEHFVVVIGGIHQRNPRRGLDEAGIGLTLAADESGNLRAYPDDLHACLLSGVTGWVQGVLWA
jgi:hypothetical protein